MVLSFLLKFINPNALSTFAEGINGGTQQYFMTQPAVGTFRRKMEKNFVRKRDNQQPEILDFLMTKSIYDFSLEK